MLLQQDAWVISLPQWLCIRIVCFCYLKLDARSDVMPCPWSGLLLHRPLDGHAAHVSQSAASDCLQQVPSSHTNDGTYQPEMCAVGGRHSWMPATPQCAFGHGVLPGSACNYNRSLQAGIPPEHHSGSKEACRSSNCTAMVEEVSMLAFGMI